MICLTLPRDLAWITRNDRERVKVQYFEEKKHATNKIMEQVHVLSYFDFFWGVGEVFFIFIDMPLIIRYIFFKEIDFVDFFCAKMRINFAFMYNSLLHFIKKPLEKFLKNTY